MGSFRKPPAGPPIFNTEGGVSSSDKLRLEEIAELLQVPSETFTGGARAPQFMAGAAELVEIWSDLDTDEDRERLLAIARSFLERR